MATHDLAQRRIAVNEGTLGKWVAKTRREREVGSSLTGDKRAELAELRRETAQLRMECDLPIKRSLAFWVKESTP